MTLHLQFTIDIRPDLQYAFACYLEQISLHAHLNPALSYYCKLFCSLEKLNTFAIKQIQTLWAKHPGVGCTSITSGMESATYNLFFLISAPSLRSLRLGVIYCRRFARPLFSYSYELLFPQTLCVHNHPHCPAVWGTDRSVSLWESSLLDTHCSLPTPRLLRAEELRQAFAHYFFFARLQHERIHD
jgi:hypothetical protein